MSEQQTPSAALIQDAKAEFTVTDSKGRVITLRKPSVLAQYNIIKMLGDTATNQTYVGMIMPLIFVVKVDGDDVPMPRTQRELDALIQRLDEEGIEAVTVGMEQRFGKMDPEQDKADVKN